MKKTKTFKEGDFVRVTEGTHQDGMPPSRMGHIYKEYKAIVHYTNEKPVPTGIWKIFMTNGKVMNFHEMFLERMNVQEEE